MKRETKWTILVAGGFLLVIFGSMLLNGYFMFLFWPAEFHPNPLNGTVALLLIGLIPWLTGTALIVINLKKAWQILLYGFGAIGGGVLVASPSFFVPGDRKACLCWLAIVAIGVIFAATMRTSLDIYRKTLT